MSEAFPIMASFSKLLHATFVDQPAWSDLSPAKAPRNFQSS